jgi:hypothetical protein
MTKLQSPLAQIDLEKNQSAGGWSAFRCAEFSDFKSAIDFVKKKKPELLK